ncbi:cell envelope integrity protein TolA [Vibrio methylphosphonaticus]|uniref:cell envelope integrity protein TolA n=1 Tax=Vibrio methylphosphonaticus TaxID=2946866 RepID=UPI002029B9BC|nr:cell envelope integrity protein TolA [Vibrio methylphosphonaticus]MCL9774737.1 cell envelope integrity protein TolA [Vibrio methylphosphonaticus]
MKKNNKKQAARYGKPITISLLAHVVLIVALLWGTDFTMKEAEPTSMVQAVVIDPARVRQQAQEIRKQRETAAKKEQDRLDKLRRESEQLERNRKAEEERIRKLKVQQAKEAQATREAEKRAKREKERAAKAESERKTQEAAVRKAEQERLAKEAAIVKAEQERVEREKAAKAAQEKARLEKEAAEKAERQRIEKEQAAKAAAEKARKEQERLKQLERERQEQEAAMNDIFAGLESESEQNTSARSNHVTSELQRMGAIYTQLIQQKLLLEDSFRGKQCRVNLRLIPAGNGAIAGEVKVLDGDSRLCAATRRAITQVGTFPLTKEADVNAKLKNINLTVVPE